jgi:hypothetical protein
LVHHPKQNKTLDTLTYSYHKNYPLGTHSCKWKKTEFKKKKISMQRIKLLCISTTTSQTKNQNKSFISNVMSMWVGNPCKHFFNPSQRYQDASYEWMKHKVGFFSLFQICFKLF